MKKRLLSLMLALVMVCTMIPGVPLTVDAATELSATPYPKIEYGYSASVQAGTIRYICQDSDNTSYFFGNYWPTPPYYNYNSPKSECSTACISMALSYVGVNTTPYEILMYDHGLTWAKTDWGGTTYNRIGSSASEISAAMDDYINGNGKYSPLVIHIKPYPSSGEEHHVVLAGKISNDSYLVIDPWSPETYTLTVSNGNASWGNNTYPIANVHQWHNPDATPSLISKTYPAYCSIKVSSSTTYVKSLPCSEDTDPNSKNVESGPAKKGDTYQAIGLVENKYGNLWYKVQTKNGSVGYMYAGDTTFVEQLKDDLTVSGVAAPTELKKGSTFSIKGTIATQYQTITKVGAWVDNSSGTYVTGGTADVNTTSYNLNASSVDNAVRFNDLGAGKYTYCIGATIKTYYASSSTAVSSKSVTVDLYESTFSVVENTACSHSYSSKVTTAATCVKNGTRTYTCSKCGASYTEAIAATGSHNYVGKITANAYCGGTGTKTFACSGCSDSYTETIPATGEHTWGGWGVRQAATCTASGVKARKCPVCYQEETQTIPATGHAFGDWVTTTAPGCGSTGMQEKTCAYCGAVQSELLYPTGHTYGDWVTTKAVGCITDGIQEKTCSSCGNVQTQKIFATGHNYTSERIPDDKNGPERICYTCSVCGDTYNEYESYVAIGECGDNLMWKLDSSGVLTIWGTGDMYMSVQQPWYSYISQIKAVVVKYGVTSIANDAFKGCGNLSTVTLSDSVTSIGSCAFEGCSSLNSITIPEGVTTIGGYAFYHCSALTNITIPASLAGVSAVKAFDDSGVKSVNYQGTVVQWLDGYTLENYAFSGISVQCTDKTIPVNVGRIGWCERDVLWYMTNDCVLTIDGTGEMPDYEFSNAPWMYLSTVIKSVVVSEGITKIGDYSFYNLKAVKTVTIPNSCEIIGNYAFKGCVGIQSVDIPQKVTSIGNQAFYGCSALTKITLPVSVENLGTQAFKASADTVRVDYSGSVARWRTLVDGSTSYKFERSAQVYCNGEKLADDILYMGTAGEHVEWFLSDTGVLTITGDGPMVSDYEIRLKYGDGPNDWYYDSTGPWGKYDTLIKDIIIEEGVTNISRNAFINLPVLESVSIPSSVATIEEQAFQGCVSLKKVNIEDGVIEIESNTFANCSALESFTVPASVSVIGAGAFSDCYELKSFVVPANVTSLGDGIFGGCIKLQSVIFEESNIEKFPRSMFWGCAALQNVKLPETLKEMGYGTFFGCTSLQTLHIPNSLKDCSYEDFGYTLGIISFSVDSDNPNYTCVDGVLFNKSKDTLVLYPQGRTDSSYYIPDTVTTIAEEAFVGNTYLENVYIPKDIYEVGNRAFLECKNLSGAYFLGGYPYEEGYDVFKQAINDSDFNYENLPNIVIYYLEDEPGWYEGCYSEYKKEVWEYETLEYAVTGGKIYIEAFTGIIIDADSSITAAEIPSQIDRWTITAIGESAFEECSNLASVVIPESVTSIGYGAFANCTSLTGITIPDGVTTIDKHAFGGCTGLVSIQVESGNTVYHNAGNCLIETATKSLVLGCKTSAIPDDGSVVSIGSYAFYKCTGLTSATIPNTVTSIGSYAFSYCTDLTTITIPESVTKIDYFAFANCTSLTDVYYGGTQEQRTQIGIGSVNKCLLDATWHYNVIPVGDDLQAAMNEAAETGATVMLTQDLEVKNAVIRDGVTLDLNGCTLKTQYFTSYGTVVDGVDGGNAVVKVGKGIHMASDSEFLPIYDSASGGYRFYKYELQNLGYKTVAGESGTLKVGVRLILNNTSGYAVLGTTENDQLDLMSSIHWTGALSSLKYTFSEATLRSYAVQVAADIAEKGSSGKAIILTIKGVDSLTEGAVITVQPTMDTVPGVQAQGQTITWNT